MSRNFKACKTEVHNRGHTPDAFLDELIAWGRTAPAEIFAPNQNFDIYNKVNPELGPWESPLHRRSGMLEVLRVLAGFESSWNHKMGVDTSRRSATTKENAEAGAWQMSYDARRLDASLKLCLVNHRITDGLAFQQHMKSDHPLSMEFIARVLRIDVKNYERISSGPVRKGDERKKTWPGRPKLWKPEESIYPWLSRAAVAEFQGFLA